MTIGDCEVQEAPGIQIPVATVLSGYVCNELIDPLHGLQDRLPQSRMPETTIPFVSIGIVAFPFHAVQEERERPLAIRVPLYAEEPLISKRLRQPSLDVLPTPYVPIVHPHQTPMAERMAVAI